MKHQEISGISSEAATEGVLSKKAFLKISQILLENTRVGVSI